MTSGYSIPKYPEVYVCVLSCVWLFATPWTEAKAILRRKCFPSLYLLSGDFLRLLIPSQMKVTQTFLTIFLPVTSIQYEFNLETYTPFS